MLISTYCKLWKSVKNNFSHWLKYSAKVVLLHCNQSTSQPHSYEESESALHDLYGQVGFVVIQWAHCEQSLELLVNTLFRQFGGNNLPRRKRMPKQLSEKIAFVKECALQIPSLVLFRVELEALASSFEAITQKRHDLVHGALTNDSAINRVFTFTRLETYSDIHEVKEFQYDLNEFPSFAASLVRLGADAPRVARLVSDAAQQSSNNRE